VVAHAFSLSSEIKSVRLKLGARPTENLALNFSGWFSREQRDSQETKAEEGQDGAHGALV
jgi:hypothetical protein